MTLLDYKIRDLIYSYKLYLTSMESKITASYSVYGKVSSTTYTVIDILVRLLSTEYFPQWARLTIYKKLIFLLRTNGYAHFELLKCPDPVLLQDGVYYGASRPGSSASTIQGVDFASFSGDPEGIYETLNFNAVSEVFYFAYPAHFPELISIKDSSGFEVAMDWVSDVRPFLCLEIIADYRVYEFKNLTTSPSMGTQFTFKFK